MSAVDSVLAFDIGGTRVKAGVVRDGEVVGFRTAPTGPTFAATMDVVTGLGQALLAVAPATAGGACMPGIIGEDGTVISLPGKMPGAEGTNVRALLEATLGLPTLVTNDAIAYGAGEAAAGAGRGFSRVLVMTIGTGIGVTVFDAGRPVTGGPYGGGQLGGHIPIAAEGGSLTDTNGGTGTIEALCRADRLADYVIEAGGSALTPEDVFAELRAGAPAAITGVERYRAVLTRALVALAHAHAPEILVVGGGPAGPGSPLLEGVEAAVNARLFGTYRAAVRLAEGGDAAALLGLAELGRRAREST